MVARTLGIENVAYIEGQPKTMPKGVYDLGGTILSTGGGRGLHIAH